MAAPAKGRGATFNPANRYQSEQREPVDDGWVAAPEDGDSEPPPLKTTVRIVAARTIISRNDSPDIPFTQSINPYQGCEHGCVYCYARPTHAYLDLSPGLDFETKLFAKPDAARLLRDELGKPGYRCEPIALGANTDPYQPIEREWKITRSVLEVLAECDHPLTITTKGVLIERDLDLLAPLAAKGLVRVFVSIAMLDRELARKLDPRAPAPHRRLQMIKALRDAGWGGDYAADDVAWWMADPEHGNNGEVAHLLHRVLKQELGFEVHLDDEQAIPWLNANRPGWDA